MRAALSLLHDPELARALGGGGVWQIVQLHAPEVLGHSLASSAAIDRAQTGLAIIEWIAARTSAIEAGSLRSAARILSYVRRPPGARRVRSRDAGFHVAVRRAVRAMLLESPAYAAAAPEERKSIANKLVNVGMVAARMLESDQHLTKQIAERPPVAEALDASDQLGMRAVNSAAQTVRNLRDSIAFPEFVQSLITGTFQAILTSTTMQLGSLGELLDNVSASATDFESTIPDGDVAHLGRAALPVPSPHRRHGRHGGSRGRIHQFDAQLKGALSASDAEVSGIDGSDIESTLLPLVRRKMGRDRQGILATMVQMGLQRIVVDDGRLEASMDLRVDAASSSQEDKQALDSLGVTAGASGSFGVGPWGASVQASTSIGRVRSDHQLTNEQIRRARRCGRRCSSRFAPSRCRSTAWRISTRVSGSRRMRASPTSPSTRFSTAHRTSVARALQARRYRRRRRIRGVARRRDRAGAGAVLVARARARARGRGRGRRAAAARAARARVARARARRRCRAQVRAAQAACRRRGGGAGGAGGRGRRRGRGGRARGRAPAGGGTPSLPGARVAARPRFHKRRCLGERSMADDLLSIVRPAAWQALLRRLDAAVARDGRLAEARDAVLRPVDSAACDGDRRAWCARG